LVAQRRGALNDRRLVLRASAFAAFVVSVLLTAGAAGAEGPLLQPFGAGPVPAAPWQVAGLPQQRLPFTRFDVVELDGARALRVEADASYGNLVHPLRLEAPHGHLAWRWRIETPVDGADLRTRAGDDTTLKVCVFFDEPLARLPFVERQLLRMARLRSTEALPAATVCYVWDPRLPEGSVLPNAYTRRLRYLVLRSGAPLQAWRSERRDLAADFLRLFGDEMRAAPAIAGVAIGADADNSHGRGLAFVADLRLEP
jgi:hypothetical protein